MNVPQEIVYKNFIGKGVFEIPCVSTPLMKQKVVFLLKSYGYLIR
jgi:hypothetical protein